ncbi:NAT_SF domain containing protein [uncultured Caudovirales phage]|uniref:NAT_SF domain containing protein n=1 Tax=uncultured Caudovirales phage TaxID=2100421 RepID=A0A6J5LWB0_9CAUD|nr:NAT_SF domain containing protein [uncultured Caudovirales phage]
MNYLDEIKTKYDIKDYVEPNIVVPKLPTEGIVLIVGTSGSGKSTILRTVSPAQSVSVDNNRTVIENFSTAETGEQLLLAAGLRSIPAWFRPPHTLSNGERHRFEVALGLDQGHSTIDEFTSVVDRDTAKSLAYSVRRWMDNQTTHQVLYIASCHRDIIDWLDPDYIYDTDMQELSARRSLHLRLGRPEITLTIRGTGPEMWRYFSKYHYLDTRMSRSVHCYVGLIGDKPVAFHAAIHSTNRDIHSYWRGHRTVVLPEFQGLGLGTAFSDAIAQMYVDRGMRYFSKTAHPSFGEHRQKSPLWRPTSTNLKSRAGSYLNKDGTTRTMPGYGGTTTARDAHRLCYSHEYIGKKDLD